MDSSLPWKTLFLKNDNTIFLCQSHAISFKTKFGDDTDGHVGCRMGSCRETYVEHEGHATVYLSIYLYLILSILTKDIHHDQRVEYPKLLH